MERSDRLAFLRPGPLGVAVAFAVAVSHPTEAQVLPLEEALRLAFPTADTVQRRTAYLDQGQLALISDVSGSDVEPPPGVVAYYVAFEGGNPAGVAYFDAHRVRTLDQVLMIVVGADDRVRRIETVSFREPPEYEAPKRWLELFRQRALNPDLSLKGDIPNLTGATLTARAVTQAVRRVLALHEVISPLNPGAGDP